MKDYRQNGFDYGYGRTPCDDGDWPNNESDRYSWREGFREGLQTDDRFGRDQHEESLRRPLIKG